MNMIPVQFHDLLIDETRALAFLATVMKNGSPQVTPVWFNTDSEHILINSAVGRTKDKNMRRDGRIALAIADPRNIYRYIQIRGRVVEIDEANGRAHIDALAKKYHGVDRYTPRRPDEQRVTYKIRIDRVTSVG